MNVTALKLTRRFSAPHTALAHLFLCADLAIAARPLPLVELHGAVVTSQLFPMIPVGLEYQILAGGQPEDAVWHLNGARGLRVFGWKTLELVQRHLQDRIEADCRKGPPISHDGG